LPWSQRQWRPKEREITRLVEAMARARADHGYSIDEIRDHALAALADPAGKGVGYVVGAFATDQLPARLLASQYELPGPVPMITNSSVTTTSADTPATALRLGACGTCNSQDGRSRASRVVLRGTRSAPCPACRPDDYEIWQAAHAAS
jgi:hypothetical protein